MITNKEKRQALIDKRDSLLAELSRVRREIAAIDKEKSQQAATKRTKAILDTIKFYGGKKKFIARFGQGLREEPEKKVGGCSDYWTYVNYDKECAYLGVPPNIKRIWCRFSGTIERRGNLYCKKHAEMIDRMASR